MTDKRHYGPILRECPACGDKLRLFSPGWFIAAVCGTVAAVTLAINLSVFPAVPRLAWLPLIAAEWIVCWRVGTETPDLWRTLWHWRHPAHCRHDRGHPVPTVSHAR